MVYAINEVKITIPRPRTREIHFPFAMIFTVPELLFEEGLT
jgi:hypothetical protein